MIPLMAAMAMMANPTSRERVEREYGLDYCRRRYPEVYAEPVSTPALVLTAEIVPT